VFDKEGIRLIQMHDPEKYKYLVSIALQREPLLIPIDIVLNERKYEADLITISPDEEKAEQLQKEMDLFLKDEIIGKPIDPKNTKYLEYYSYKSKEVMERQVVLGRIMIENNSDKVIIELKVNEGEGKTERYEKQHGELMDDIVDRISQFAKEITENHIKSKYPD
jgi:hypothetical protein